MTTMTKTATETLTMARATYTLAGETGDSVAVVSDGKGDARRPSKKGLFPPKP